MVLLCNVAYRKKIRVLKGLLSAIDLVNFLSQTLTVRDNPHLLPWLKDEGEASSIIYKVYIMLTCNIALIVCILAY